jgi:hypothetical protein
LYPCCGYKEVCIGCLPLLQVSNSVTKIKVVPTLNQALCQRDMWGNSGIAPHSLNFGTNANKAQWSYPIPLQGGRH